MTYDYANENMYVSAFKAYRANLPSVVMVSLMYLGLDALGTVVESKLLIRIGYAWAGIIFAFAIHKTVLGYGAVTWKMILSNSNSDFYSKTFLYRSFAFLGMLFAIIMVLIPIAYVSKLDAHGAVGVGMIGYVLFGLTLYGVLIAIYGTALPAAVANTDSSFRTAFRRGKSQFWFVFLRLLVGPTLFTVISSLGFIAVGELGVPTEIHSVDTSWNLLGGIVGFFIGVVGLFGLALTATILCKAYVRGEAASSALRQI